MADGFKLLDAYVEVTASGKGIADKVAGDIHRESSGSRGLGSTGSTMGGNLLGGLKSAFTTGAVGGLVGGVVGGVASGLTSIVAGAISDVGSMLATVGSQVASTVIDFNSQLQNSTIGFETMLGSGKKAKSFMDDLQEFAKTTPFEFTDLVSNAQLMMGMGIAAKDVIPDLTALGDSVAAMGGSADQVNSVTLAFSQMASKGTLDMGNMTQLLQGGVPSALKVLAASYHVTTGKMIENISAGKILASDALPRLVKGIEKGTKATAGLGGMMDKQSSTFTGALSNIKDAFTQTTAKAFKPFFDAASNGMQRFAKALSGKPAEKFQKDVTKTLKPFAKEIEKWFKGIDFNKMFKGASEGLKKMFKGVDPEKFGKDLKGFGDDVKDVFDNIVRIAPKVGKVMKEAGPAIKETIKQGVAFIGWMADTIDWFDKTEKAWLKWRKQFVDGMDGFFHDADGFWNDLSDGWDGFWRDVGGTIANGWNYIVGVFQHGGQQILDFFGGLPNALTTIGTNMVQGLIGGLQDAWGGITSTLHDLAMALPEPVRNALGIHSPSKVFHLIGRQVGQGLQKGLLGSVDEINSAADKLAEAVMSDKRWKGTKLGANMVAGIRHEAGKLRDMSRARAAAMEDVANDKSRLSDLYGQRKDYASNARSNVMGNASATSIFGESMQTQRDARQAAKDFNKDLQPTVMGAGTVTLNGNSYTPSWTTSVAAKAKAVPKVSAHAGLLALKASLKKLLADTKKFTANMKKLAKMGVDAFTYDELVNAGVRGGGLETSDALIKDPKLAKQIFTLEHQVSSAGRSLGRTTSTHRYAGRIADAKDQLSQDQAEVHHYNVTMVVEANKIDEVSRLINMVKHVKSTSRKGSAMKKHKR